MTQNRVQDWQGGPAVRAAGPARRAIWQGKLGMDYIELFKSHEKCQILHFYWFMNKMINIKSWVGWQDGQDGPVGRAGRANRPAGKAGHEQIVP